MKYATAAAFRQALDGRLKAESEGTGLPLARLRKRVAFELFLRRLVAVAPDRWILKGALALDFRFKATSRATKDMDLGRADTEDAAIEDFVAAQELDLGDFFSFAVTRNDDLEGADDFRAIRFHVTAELAGRVFDDFVVDVGFVDSISTERDEIETSGLLSFAGIEPVRIPALPLPQHIAEKVHAYMRTYGESREHAAEGSCRHPPHRRRGSHRRGRAADSPRDDIQGTCAPAAAPSRYRVHPAPGKRRTGGLQRASQSSQTSRLRTHLPRHSSIQSFRARHSGSGIPSAACGVSPATIDRRG